MPRLTNREIFDRAREYLLGLPGVTKKILDAHLAFPEQNRPWKKEDLFKRMIDHAQNRQGMPNYIGDTRKLAPFLFNFDVDVVVERYGGWVELFDAIRAKIGRAS